VDAWEDKDKDPYREKKIGQDTVWETRLKRAVLDLLNGGRPLCAHNETEHDGVEDDDGEKDDDRIPNPHNLFFLIILKKNYISQRAAVFGDGHMDRHGRNGIIKRAVRLERQ
jgi:hypothetical protein